MYVCMCHSVTDSDIHQLVRVEGVRSLDELGERLGVATQCGKCAQCAKGVLRDAVRAARCDRSCPDFMAAA